MENQNSPKIVYYFHAGSENHGCEAIVRSTTDLLNTKPLLFSDNPAGDKKYGIDGITELKTTPHLSYSSFEKIRIKLSGSDELAYYLRAKHEAGFFPDHSIALSIGGDNYCYGDTYNWHLAGLNDSLHKRSIKTVLWGCSINPESVTDKMKKDFSKYDLIVAREHISYDFLKQINPNTFFACDPAFTLKEERLPLPEQFIEGKTVGINLSPLIQKNEQTEGITYANYQNLVRYIINHTEYNIAFIPHVVQDGNDDRVPLKKLYNEVNDKSRVCIIDDCNCMQLKGFISRCCLFVGARTHATIAAYSSCVPTLVVGYSTKAKGIAEDLFKSDKGYVLSVQSLEKQEELTKAFSSMNDNKEQINKNLMSVMPDYSKTILRFLYKIRTL